jgi:hypothetical protein
LDEGVSGGNLDGIGDDRRIDDVEECGEINEDVIGGEENEERIALFSST